MAPVEITGWRDSKALPSDTLLCVSWPESK